MTKLGQCRAKIVARASSMVDLGSLDNARTVNDAVKEIRHRDAAPTSTGVPRGRTLRATKSFSRVSVMRSGKNERQWPCRVTWEKAINGRWATPLRRFGTPGTNEHTVAPDDPVCTRSLGTATSRYSSERSLGSSVSALSLV